MFRKVIRVVFIFAYGAFLYASLRHIAYFFASFEPVNTDWQGSYAIAISIDATALVLTIGIMFFRKGMSTWALAGIWFFILGLTAFSWLVNWEYAIQFQSSGLNKATDFLWLNPILASSFALLNVAYSIVAELFNSKAETAEELQQKLEELRQTSALKQELSTHKNKQVASWISGKYQMFKEGFSSIKPVPENGINPLPELEPEPSQDLPESELSQNLPMMVIPDSISPIDGKLFMTFPEAVEYTGYAESTLKKQLSLGQIQTNKKGDKLKVSSLKIKGNTLELPAVKVDKVPATNGHKT